jgi:hypothetical protein
VERAKEAMLNQLYSSIRYMPFESGKQFFGFLDAIHAYLSKL